MPLDPSLKDAMDPDVFEVLEDVVARLDALEKVARVPVHPIRVVEQYDGLPDRVYEAKP